MAACARPTEVTAGSRNFAITGHSQMNIGTKELLQPFNTEFFKFDTGDKHFDDERLKQTKVSASRNLSNSPFGHEMEAGIFAKVHIERIIPSLRLGTPSRPLIESSLLV